MQSLQTNGPFSFVAAEVLTARKLVTIDSNGKAALAGAVVPAGHVQEATAAIGGPAIVHECRGIARLTAGGAVTAIGHYVKGATGGKVVAETTPTTPTVSTVAIALSTTAADGDEILVLFV